MATGRCFTGNTCRKGIESRLTVGPVRRFASSPSEEFHVTSGHTERYMSGSLGPTGRLCAQSKEEPLGIGTFARAWRHRRQAVHDNECPSSSYTLCATLWITPSDTCREGER